MKKYGTLVLGAYLVYYSINAMMALDEITFESGIAYNVGYILGRSAAYLPILLGGLVIIGQSRIIKSVLNNTPQNVN